MSTASLLAAGAGPSEPQHDLGTGLNALLQTRGSSKGPAVSGPRVDGSPVGGPSVSWGLQGPASGLCFAETPSVEISTQETTLQVSVSLHSVWAAYSCVGEILNSTGKGPLPRLTGDQQEAVVKGYLPAEVTWQLIGQKAAPETPGPEGTGHAWLLCFPCTDFFECLHFLTIREFNTKIPISAL